MTRLDPHLATLKALPKKLAKAKPQKAHGLLHDAFRVALLAGDTTRARQLLDLLYGGLPPAKSVATALSTHAMDVVCQEAGFGDLTRGQPTFVQSFVIDGTLAERVAVIDRGIRTRLAWNSYDGDYPDTDAWRDLPADDPDRDIDRWRRIQALYHPDLATPASLADAWTRLHELLDDWPAGQQSVGMGAELAVACDLELRLDPSGAPAVIARWLDRHQARLSDGNLVDSLLCLPPVAAHMLRGGFRTAIAATDEALATAFAEVFAATAGLTGSPTPGKVAKPDLAKVQKRTVTCEYSQVHIEPAERTAAEAKQVYFQDPRDSAQGMSLFPTMVGVATPSETEAVDVEWQSRPAPAGGIDLGAAVQAVAFPLEVRGPVVVRSVSSGDDEEPLAVDPGRYDVLALFLPKGRKGKASLRRFVLRLTLFPAGSLQAPACFRLEDGSSPPARGA